MRRPGTASPLSAALAAALAAALLQLGTPAFAVEPVAGIEITRVDVRATDPLPPRVGDGYASVFVAGPPHEHRLYRHGFHFASIIDDGNGTFAIRPRAGVDRNGFGSTLYLSPFIAGAELKGAVTATPSAEAGGIRVAASGEVSKGPATNGLDHGAWDVSLRFQYDPGAKTVVATGTYSVALSAPIAQAGGDLNLYRLASNYLRDVPKIGGGTGDTGDLGKVVYASENGGPLEWIPTSGPHFPSDESRDLEIDARPAFYDVDNLGLHLGYCPIQAAHKPGLAVRLHTVQTDRPMKAGFYYETSQALQYFSDNVGVTPIIGAASPHQQFDYTVTLESTVLPGDGRGVDVRMEAEAPGTAGNELDVFHLPTLYDADVWLVGKLHRVSGDLFRGEFAVPFPPGADFREGSFRVSAACQASDR